MASLGRLAPRDRECMSTSLRGALATKQSILSLRCKMDCFASLAMTMLRCLRRLRLHAIAELREAVGEAQRGGAGVGGCHQRHFGLVDRREAVLGRQHPMIG